MNPEFTCLYIRSDARRTRRAGKKVPRRPSRDEGDSRARARPREPRRKPAWLPFRRRQRCGRLRQGARAQLLQGDAWRLKTMRPQPDRPESRALAVASSLGAATAPRVRFVTAGQTPDSDQSVTPFVFCTCSAWDWLAPSGEVVRWCGGEVVASAHRLHAHACKQQRYVNQWKDYEASRQPPTSWRKSSSLKARFAAPVR